MCFTATAIMLYAGVLLQSQVTRTEPLTVCQILSHRAAYRGLRVTVRGRLVATPEGTYLEGDGCQPLITDGYTWATTAIDIQSAKPPLAVDHKSVKPAKTVLLDLQLLQRAAPDGTLFVTLIGRFETTLHFVMVLRGDGKTVPNGYGHLNACPGQIIYDEMKDVTVVSPKH
jgi:hypothetical protein